MGKTRFRESELYARDFGLIDSSGNLLPFNLQHVLPGGRMAFNIRKKFTRSEVNAGAVVIPGDDSYKIRLVDLALATEGGAPGTENITIESTQSASGVALATFAHGDLGDNDYATLLDGTTTLLNAGASLEENDAGADVTIESAGVTTVDHIHVVATYALEPA